VKEMYFIRQGVVQVINPDHDILMDTKGKDIEKEREKIYRD